MCNQTRILLTMLKWLLLLCLQLVFAQEITDTSSLLGHRYVMQSGRRNFNTAKTLVTSVNSGTAVKGYLYRPDSGTEQTFVNNWVNQQRTYYSASDSVLCGYLSTGYQKFDYRHVDGPKSGQSASTGYRYRCGYYWTNCSNCCLNCYYDGYSRYQSTPNAIFRWSSSQPNESSYGVNNYCSNYASLCVEIDSNGNANDFPCSDSKITIIEYGMSCQEALTATPNLCSSQAKLPRNQNTHACDLTDSGRCGDICCYSPVVNGGYSSWSSCNVSCFTGTQTRTCTNPVPSGGGNDCTSLGPATQACTAPAGCGPVDGGYSNWSACDATCSIGTQTRVCDNPFPAWGGLDCETAPNNLGLPTQACDTGVVCPVNGQWSAFQACSASCGGGTWSRVCNNPPPSGGGLSCVGKTTDDCNTLDCPIEVEYVESAPTPVVNDGDQVNVIGVIEPQDNSELTFFIVLIIVVFIAFAGALVAIKKKQQRDFANRPVDPNATNTPATNRKGSIIGNAFKRRDSVGKNNVDVYNNKRQVSDSNIDVERRASGVSDDGSVELSLDPETQKNTNLNEGNLRDDSSDDSLED